MRQITKEDIDSIREPWVWDLGNRILYDMCQSYPGHTEHDAIIAKIWLIGRSYAAAIERRKNAKHIGDDFYEAVVAPTMRSKPIDLWLDSLQTTDKSINIDTEGQGARHDMKGPYMKTVKAKKEDMRKEYRREDLGVGVRGKSFNEYKKGTNLVLLSPDVAAAFPDEDSVNTALRGLIKIAERSRIATKRSPRTVKKQATG